MIDVIKPLETAWKRTEIILFQPFQIEKWLAIGFAAFLIQPFGQGGSVPNPGSLGNHGANRQELSHLHHHFYDWITPFTIALMVTAGLFILVMGLLLMWVRAHGRLMLLDNIVRNRGRIVEPWKRYTKQATQLFLFNVVISFGLLVLMAGLLSPLFLILLEAKGNPTWEIFLVFADLAVFIIVWIPVVVFTLLFDAFGVPLMFRHGLSPWAAFKATAGLIRRDPVGLGLMFLVLIGLGITVGIATLLGYIFTCCVLWCFLLIPYVGSVLLLPVTVFYNCYYLDILAQFGPEYNVWTVDTDPVQPLPGWTPPPAF